MASSFRVQVMEEAEGSRYLLHCTMLRRLIRHTILNPFRAWNTRRKALNQVINRGYRILQTVKDAKVYIVEKNTRRYVYKKTGELGLIAYRDILPMIVSIDNRIVVPKMLQSWYVSMSENWVVLSWVDGERFSIVSKSNNLIDGGRSVGLDTIGPWTDALERLTQIDIENLPLTRRQLQVSSTYAEKLIQKIEPVFVRKGWLSDIDFELTRSILSPLAKQTPTQKSSVTNGDFHLDNLVRLDDGSFAIVDWEAMRISHYEIEHAVSLQWLLMWNNDEWREELIKAARSKFTIDPELFRATLLLRALRRANYFQRDEKLREILMRNVKMALSDQEMSDVFSF